MDLDKCDRINDVNVSFLSLSFQHTYREHNSSVDDLSNEALSSDMGKFFFIEYLEGEVIGNGNLRLF